MPDSPVTRGLPAPASHPGTDMLDLLRMSLMNAGRIPHASTRGSVDFPHTERREKSNF